jgi:hypothetical protein
MKIDNKNTTGERIDSLKRFESARADKKKNNICDYCGKNFSNMEELTVNYRKDHPEPR